MTEELCAGISKENFDRFMLDVNHFRDNATGAISKTMRSLGCSETDVRNAALYYSILKNGKKPLTFSRFVPFMVMLTPDTFREVLKDIYSKNLYNKNQVSTITVLTELAEKNAVISPQTLLKLTPKKELKKKPTAGLSQKTYDCFMTEIQEFREFWGRRAARQLRQLGYVGKNEPTKFAIDYNLFKKGEKEVNVGHLMFYKPILSQETFCLVGKELVANESYSESMDRKLAELLSLIEQAEPGYLAERRKRKRIRRMELLQRAYEVCSLAEEVSVNVV